MTSLQTAKHITAARARLRISMDGISDAIEAQHASKATLLAQFLEMRAIETRLYQLEAEVFLTLQGKS